jgi:hypothetical protein
LEALCPLITQTLTLSSHLQLSSVILRYYTKPDTRHSKPRAYTPELWYHTRHSTRRKHRHQGKASKQASHLRAIRPARLPPLGSPTKPSERERETRTPEDNKNQHLPSHPISIKCSSHQTYTKRETPELSLEPPIILRQEASNQFPRAVHESFRARRQCASFAAMSATTRETTARFLIKPRVHCIPHDIDDAVYHDYYLQYY